MELRHLRYFVALAEELHFGKAAARMHITQPPLSRQIKELEKELEVTLFARNNKMVRLTEPGRIFLEHARQLQELLDHTIKITRRAHRGEFGRLAIGYLGGAAFHLLPNVLRHFRENHPDVELILHGMITSEQLEALLKGSIDVGIMRPTFSLDEYRSELILREPFVVALPMKHTLARRRDIHIRSLAQEKFVMLPPTPGGGLYRQILELCLQAKFEPKVVQVATETRSVVGLVGAGIGISIVPSSVQRMAISNVVYRRLRGVRSYAEMVMVWRKDGETPVVSQFLRAVREAAASLTPLERG
jgi:DNA-binding transcriptional LysR family regulator